MGRGRPKGSRNKIQDTEKLEIKKLKKEIKDLRAEKLSLPSGNEKRIELHREIKRLRQLLKDKKDLKINTEIEVKEINDIKDPIIKEILKIEAEQNTKPTFEVLGIDLRKYSLENLKIHLKKLQERW
jgi:hypothetical protein